MNQREAHSGARALLSLLVAVLLASGAGLQAANNLAAEAAALPSATTTPTVTATATPTSSPTLAQNPLLNQVARGCNLDLTASQTAANVGKCKILVVGDSLGNNLGWGMYEQLKDTPGITMYVRSKASTGLTKPSYYNWPQELAPMLKKYKPNLVVVMLGANDWQDRKTNGDRGNAAWRTAYKKDIKTVASMSTAAGAYVMWVGLPIMRLTRYGKGMATLNSLYAEALPAVEGATFVPTWDFFADANGDYRDYAQVNGKRTKMRGSDGIHFSTIGQGVLATYVIKQLRAIYHVDFKARATKRITG